MAAFASYQDVEAVWRPLTNDETEAVTRRLEQASRIIRQRVPDIDARITAGTLDAGVAMDVAVDMVVRYLRNPEGYRQEAIEDYSRTRDSALSEGVIYLSDAEYALLSEQTTKPKAFSITPTVEEPTCATFERIARHRAGWDRT